MKLISWKKVDSIDYDLAISTTYLSWRGWMEATVIYRGNCTCWCSRETGRIVSATTALELHALWKRIKWGDFPDLERKT